MAKIVEEIFNKESKILIDVLNPEIYEFYGPYEIINVDFNGCKSTFTPNEIIKIGEWLISQAKRIKKEYTSEGVLKEKKSK